MTFLHCGRSLDIQEFELGGTKMYDTPLVTFSNSLVIVDNHGDLYAIGGVNSNGLVWMLCTKSVERNKIRFLRYTKELLEDTIKTIPRLYNCVWLKNDLHVKWLKWLGATFGVSQGGFQYFEFNRGDK